MKLGFSLYRHMLDREHYRFARQCGATHLVIHLVDYFHRGSRKGDQPLAGGRGGGWGRAGDPQKLWTADQLGSIRDEAAAEGLELYAVENFDPAHWHDILLDGPLREAHVENVHQILRALGETGIAVMGYNFSLAGVYGRVKGSWARGGAVGVGMAGEIDQEPMPDGMVWNMCFDERAEDTARRSRISADELWSRLQRFLADVLPVAEASGVKLAAHPDDPPVERLRDTPRLVYRPELYQKLLDLAPSPSNTLEFCLGTVAEMQGADVYEATRRYAAQGKLSYVHFRNVRGQVPNYREVFIDEGDIDMPRVLRILADNGFGGVLVPDHAPQMDSPAPWHAGMAHAMGYMKALIDGLS
jgi:mannonate dehydratase